jgi:hypothetical protein
MAVTIEPGSPTRLRRSPTGFVVRVDAGDPDQVAACREALGLTRARLLGLDDPDPELGLDPRHDRNEVAHVSPVMATPAGAAIYVDGGHVSPRRLVQVLDWAVEDLHQQGVEDAVVAVPTPSVALEQVWEQRSGPRLELAHVPVVALTPPPAPPEWADAAIAWLVDDPALVAAGVTALVVSQEFAVDSGDVLNVLALDRPELSDTRTVLVGDPSTGVRFATYENRRGCYVLSLGSSGNAVKDAQSSANWLIGIAERLAGSCSYAFIEFPAGSPLDLQEGPPGRPPRFDHMDVLDEVALDAFPFQVLGPGHLRRLGALPEARPLAAGRVAWTLGSLSEWTDDRRATQLRALGRTMLAPILLDRDPLFELGRSRMLADMAERQRLREQS